jgi:hypothetical protein
VRERMRKRAPTGLVLGWESAGQVVLQLTNHNPGGASVVLLPVELSRRWWSLGQGANTGLSPDCSWSFAVDLSDVLGRIIHGR